MSNPTPEDYAREIVRRLSGGQRAPAPAEPQGGEGRS